MNRKRLVWLIIFMVLLTLGFCGPRWLGGPVVDSVMLAPRDLTLTLVVNGRVLAPRRVVLGVPQTGVVAERLVDEGDRVAPGQLLLRLDDAEARANLAKAEAELSKLKLVTREASRLAEDQAASTQKLAQWIHERNEQLYRDGVIPESVLQDSSKALEQARAARQSAGIQLQSLRDGSDLRLAEANLELARVKWDQTRVMAPAAAVVLTRSVELGDQVQPGKVLFTLALDEPLQIQIQPDERYLADLAVGQAALVSADAFPRQRQSARVSFIAPAVDATRGTVDVRLTLADEAEQFRPDMTVSVEIQTGMRSGALVIPLSALRSGSRPNVLVHRSGRAERVFITPGHRGETEVELVSGLSPGDVVLLSLAMKEGDRCRVDPGQK